MMTSQNIGSPRARTRVTPIETIDIADETIRNHDAAFNFPPLTLVRSTHLNYTMSRHINRKKRPPG